VVVVDIPPLAAGVGLAVVGLFSGFGNAAGMYLFQRYLKGHVLDRINGDGKLGDVRREAIGEKGSRDVYRAVWERSFR